MIRVSTLILRLRLIWLLVHPVQRDDSITPTALTVVQVLVLDNGLVVFCGTNEQFVRASESTEAGKGDLVKALAPYASTAQEDSESPSPYSSQVRNSPPLCLIKSISIVCVFGLLCNMRSID